MRSFFVLLCAASTLPAVDVDPLLPAETDQVTIANVKRIVSSEIVKNHVMRELKEKLKATPVPAWLDEMGIDPWKDIDAVAMGVISPPKKKTPDEKDVGRAKILLVARGRFNGEKLMAAAEKAVREAGDTISIVQENKLKLIKVKIPGDQFFHLTLVDEKTLIAASTPEMIQTAIRRADSGETRPQVKPALVELARNLDEKTAYGQVMELEKDAFSNIGENPLFEDTELLKKQLAEMTSYAFSLKVGTDVQFELAGAMTGKEAANGFGETAKAMVEKGKTLLPLAVVAAPEWTNVINDLKKSMKISVTDNIVKLHARITGSAISKGLGADE